METCTSADSRHYGVDLLRLVATGMIIAHHLITQGGLSAMFPRLSASDVFYHSVNIICYCAVNLYGLISGYVGVGCKARLSRLLELWLQMVFTSLAVTLAFAAFSGERLSIQTWLEALTPVSSNQYWYCTAYLCMYVFLPAIHQALDHMNKRCYTQMLAAAFVMFCILPLISGRDSFQIVYGYHTLWLMVLYAAGYYFRRFGFGWLGRHAVWVYAGCMGLAIACRLVLEALDLYAGFAKVPVTLMEKYTSPTLAVGSAALVAWFTNIQLKGKAARMVAALTPMALGVYLFHVHPLVYNRLIAFCFVPFAGFGSVQLLAWFAAACAGVYGGCVLLDGLRIWIFKLLDVKKRLAALEKKLNAVSLFNRGA